MRGLAIEFVIVRCYLQRNGLVWTGVQAGLVEMAGLLRLGYVLRGKTGHVLVPGLSEWKSSFEEGQVVSFCQAGR